MGTGGAIKTYSFATREEAERERAAAVRAVERVRQQQEALTWASTIERYMEFQRERAKATEQSLQVVEERLRRFFLPVLEEAVSLTQESAQRLYRELRTRKGARGAVASVQEHHHCLSRAKALVRWCVREKLLRVDHLAEVEAVGRPRRGEESKAQLNRDGLRKLVSVALDHGERGDAGAAAVLCASLLGMRASAIINRRREHLDDGGRILKTAGKGRSVELCLVGQTPEQEIIMSRLRRVLALQARGKLPGAPLIGTGHDRWWVRREVRRLCKVAEVPIVPPHGLRGTHASVGRELGISPALLAGALAHSEQVQERHYARPAAVAAGQVSRVVDALGEAGSTFPALSQTKKAGG